MPVIRLLGHHFESRLVPVATIVRLPLSNRTTSMNIGAPLLSAKRKQVAPKPPPAKPAVSVPLPYKTGFGFIPAGAPRLPEERERIRKERLAFFHRSCAYRRKNLPKFKFHRVPTFPCEMQYTREYVGQQTDYFRILPSPALLAPPATDFGGQVIDTDTLAVIPGIQLHVPPAWNEWCPTDLPAHDTEVDEAMLFVPPTTPSGGLYAEDLARHFPILWREFLAEHEREVRAQMKRRARVHKAGSRRRL
jgi:hypothetical protein